MSHMKRSSIEPLIENVGETGCLEPAFKQKTNDDDDETIWFKLWHKQDKLVFFHHYSFDSKSNGRPI